MVRDTLLPVPALPAPGAMTSVAGATRVKLPELLASLSHALDLTEGQPAGHTVRSCLIGMRIAEDLGLDAARRSALYYALLLKDAGCSSNAARMAALFGSPDQSIKYRMKRADWHRRFPLAIQTARTVGAGRSLRARIQHFAEIARTEDVTRNLIAIRCDRGAAIVRQLGFPEETADAVRFLDEHWCGKGYPEGRRGEEIPLLARIANLAQTVELFHAAQGREAALRVVRQRRGTWFDPRLVDLLLGWKNDRAWWDGLRGPDVALWAAEAEPGACGYEVDPEGLDTMARTFADIIDAKSPYTFRHSTNVAEFARGIAREFGFNAAEQRRIYRAGLLHDIGKLGISNRILDKNGPLTPEERTEIELHPVYSWQILSRAGAFRDFAWTAVLHHEKLDGSGYPWKLGANELDSAARILCVADIYEALTADRPYRAGMTSTAALEILHRDIPTRLCAETVGGLEAWISSGGVARSVAA